MDLSHDLRSLIQREVRRTVPLPVVRDTGQNPPDAQASIARTTAATWDIWYQASSGNLPEADTPAWTEHETGTPSATVSGGVLAVVADGGAAESDYWGYSNAAFTGPCEIEALVKVSSADAGAHKGSCLSLHNGTWQFVVWLRDDGLNIDGEADVAVTLSDDYHRVRMVVRDKACEVYVDGTFLQRGGPANATTATGVTFGSWTSKDAFAA